MFSMISILETALADHPEILKEMSADIMEQVIGMHEQGTSEISESNSQYYDGKSILGKRSINDTAISTQHGLSNYEPCLQNKLMKLDSETNGWAYPKFKNYSKEQDIFKITYHRTNSSKLISKNPVRV